MQSDAIQFGTQDYEVINREVVYQGVFRLVRNHIKQRLFDGGWSEVYIREVMERLSAAAILPYDPILDRVILIEQMRPGAMQDEKTPWMFEIPAGVLHAHDTPKQLAINEADEEAGCKILDIIPLSEFYVSPGGSNEYLWMFCGRIDATNVKGVHGLKHEHEDIRVHNLTFEEAIQKLNDGIIKTAPAILSLYWLQVNREKLRNLWK